MTIWVVHFNGMIDFLEVEDATLESYIDELVADGGENFEEVTKELFSYWCKDEFGWDECESAFCKIEDAYFDEDSWYQLF